MVVQILVLEGEWSVYEDTPPTPDHTPANGVEPSLKIRAMKMGFPGWIKKQSEKVKTNRVGLQFQGRVFQLPYLGATQPHEPRPQGDNEHPRHYQ